MDSMRMDAETAMTAWEHRERMRAFERTSWRILKTFSVLGFVVLVAAQVAKVL